MTSVTAWVLLVGNTAFLAYIANVDVDVLALDVGTGFVYAAVDASVVVVEFALAITSITTTSRTSTT